MTSIPFANADVSAVFAGYPEDIRPKLLALRQLIFDTAEELDEVGELTETLKWGQPSYLTMKPKTGTTIRIDQSGAEPGKYALYVHCQTSLVETFRQRYPNELTYEGNRAIVFNVDDKLSVDQLRDCIELALTYHVSKDR